MTTLGNKKVKYEKYQFPRRLQLSDSGIADADQYGIYLSVPRRDHESAVQPYVQCAVGADFKRTAGEDQRDPGIFYADRKIYAEQYR